ncbi:MAG: hypothetical protein KGJ23_03225 [Euryarchaeota archaeon]|nr:hypothetical protein [Euryarchaeota archaeon]MDE2043768.1 hypothetical protein [Thermoplasmata archaeon]
MSGALASALRCPKCGTGTLAKLATGWTCEQCGFAPFAGREKEKVPPPSPINPRTVDPAGRPFSASDLAADAPPKVRFNSLEKRPEALRVQWMPAGAGLRYASRVSLQTVPPGENVPLELLAHNQGPHPLSLEYYVQLTGRSGVVAVSRVYSGDLPPEGVLDATVLLPPPDDPEGCRVSTYCRALPATGRLQPELQPPGVAPVQGSVSLPVQPTDPDVKFLTSVRCPRCENRMAWVPGGPRRARAWVCDACQHRVETGLLG